MRVLSLFVVNWYQECFRVVVDSPRQSIVYNRYATLIFTNPVLLGFSRYQNVNFGSLRVNCPSSLSHHPKNAPETQVKLNRNARASSCEHRSLSRRYQARLRRRRCLPGSSTASTSCRCRSTA